VVSYTIFGAVFSIVVMIVPLYLAR